jgi:putative ABC transport system permease protein
MGGLAHDFRYSVRQLRRTPGFTAVAVLTLAFGIAATTVLYSILDGAYIHFAPTEQGNRNTLITQKFTRNGTQTTRFSAAEYFDIERFSGPFEGFLALRHSGAALTDEAERGASPEQVPIVKATANIFSLNGISPLIGRVLTAEDDSPGGPNVAVLTYRLWNRRFARDRSIVGKTIRLDGIPYTILGVTPRRFQAWGADLYLPLGLDPASTDRSIRDLTVSGVRKKGITAEQTKPFLQDLARRMEAQYSAANPEYAGLVYEAYDVRAGVIGDLRIAIYLLMGAVGLLLLIAATNLASFLLARALSRAREIATCLAIGATRARLVRQFLAESTLLSVLSTVSGVALAILALKPVMALIPAHYIGEESDVHINAVALVVSVLVALILGIFFGITPAILISGRTITANLGQSRTALAANRGTRARSLLVLAQITLAFAVLTAAGLMIRTYREIGSIDLGFVPDHVLTMRVALPAPRYPGNSAVLNFSRELIANLRALPGVVDVAMSSKRPMEEGASFLDFSIPTRPLNSTTGLASAAYRVVTSSYFTLIRNPLHDGRSFTKQDASDAPPVIIVNQSFARTFMPGQSALGKQIRLLFSNETHDVKLAQIVGIVADSRQFAREVHDVLYEPSPPEVFLPLLQNPESARDLAVLLRTQGEAGTLTAAIRRQIQSLKPDQPVYDVQTLQAMTDDALGPARLCLVILASFAVTALVIACIGLYAIISYAVVRRTQEMGVRMALGAGRHQIVNLILIQGMQVAALGIAAGLVASFGTARLMSSLLYRVSSHDFVTLITVSVLLTSVALLASYIPARRAAKVDPMVALRYE